MRDEETGFIGAAARGYGGSVSRPAHNRGMSGTSYASTSSAISNQDTPVYSGGRIYHDPFTNPFADENELAADSRRPRPQLNQPLQIQTMLPVEVHSLSPVTEISRTTLSQSDHTESLSSQSHERISPFNTLSQATSRTSFNPRPSSLLDTNFDSHPVRRSDSWWSRFSRHSILDRRGSGSRQLGGMPDIRDPNPPPRLGGLVAIEESQNSISPERDSLDSNSITSSIKRALSRGNDPNVYTGKHEKSLSSLRTADSEAIERMAGAVDVVQRERTTGSQGTRGSTRSYDSNSVWLPEEGHGIIHGVDMSSFDVQSPVDMGLGESLLSLDHPTTPPKAASPVITPPISQPSTAASSNTSVNSAGVKRPIRTPTGSAVAARVQDYEKRMSQDQFVPSPTNTRQHEERSNKRKPNINYGLTSRPSLFVANPDKHRQGSSQDSQS